MASGNGSAQWREETVRVDDSDLIVVKGGTGNPLLILHEGAILDFFQRMAPKHLYATVHDPDATPEFDELYGGQGPAQFEHWEEARAQSARLAWTPFMHNPSLPHLLGVASNLPTLLVWGRQDRVVPIAAADEYKRVMKSARLTVLENCGHRPEVEQTPDFLREVEAFLQ